LPLAGLAVEGIRITDDAPYLMHAGSAAAAEMMLIDGHAGQPAG
jgi:phosphonate transport system substrate-binding protein